MPLIFHISNNRNFEFLTAYLVDHTKGGQSYPDDKYFLVRSNNHVPVHGGVIPIQQPPSVSLIHSCSSHFIYK